MYTSLHLNSEYSFHESAITIDKLIEFAKLHNLKSLVLTDHNNMYGVFEFINKCKKHDIKPIVGLDLDVENFRLVLIAKNYEGFQELTRLSTLKMQGETINEDQINSDNLFVVDHPTYGAYFLHERELKIKDAYQIHKNWVAIAETKTLAMEDNETITLLEAYKDNVIVEKSYIPYGEAKFFEPELRKLESILNECNLIFPKHSNLLPSFNGEFGDAYLHLEQITSNVLLKKSEFIDKPAYEARLKMELAVIKKLNYASYFLILHDITNFARESGIKIGPGRGSAPGSLICFLLGITEIDPIPNNLLFERFLNLERISQPDIDMDIQDDRRDEVIQYVFKKYGPDRVALITTISRLGAKSALRDVARFFNLPIREVNDITKLIGLNNTLDEAFKNNRFQALIRKNELYTNIFKKARLIEGFARQIGTHAAGIIITNIELVKHFPLTKSAEGYNQIQLTMDYLEENGLLKIDLLGLRTLTIINEIQREIYTKYQKSINLKMISTNDSKTNAMLSEGDSSGIFQLESFGMRATLIQVKVDSISDIVAIISLFRPGPMEQIKLYTERKHKRLPIETVNPAFDEITKETYGILVYQEQIMQVAQRFANLTFGEADVLRRAIGKKDGALIESMRNKFFSGAKQLGHQEAEINNIFGLIEKFAEYGFNKSHAFAYATLSYRMAYLKAWFPQEFYIALMNSSLGSQETIKRYIVESRAKGIKIVAPSINLSLNKVYMKDQNTILPLNLIKGFGSESENKIINEHQVHGSFKTFFEAVARLRHAGIGEAQLKLLIKASALSEFGNTNTLLQNLEGALRYTDIITIKEKEGKSLDFDLFPQPVLQEAEYNEMEAIEFEFELYGLPLSVFPTSKYEKSVRLADLKMNGSQTVVFFYSAFRLLKDKNNNEFAKIMVFDSTTALEITVFASE